MLASRLWLFRKDCHSVLVNCEPWSEWTVTLALGLRRQSAIRRAFKTRSVCMRECIDQPTTRREYRSMTTARYSQPMGADIGDISYPDPIRGRNGKVLLQLVGGNNGWLMASVSGAALIAYLCLQTGHPHQSGNGVRRACLTQTKQIMMDLAIAINTPTLQP